MSTKVRIYQLAKDLDVSTKDVLAVLDTVGVEYKSHSSTLEHEVAETVRQLISQEGETGGEGAEAEIEPITSETASAPSDTEMPSAKPTATVSHLPRRAPVVTVMGHVDHGKTTLLDHIRQTRVADREAGGITQHIGAYQVNTPHGAITFLDTPGHEAFTTIRQRGANATDIAIIVIAADDGVMPQTREAIAHARAANVPLIVAINKTDLPQANPEKVKQDLMRLELVPEEYGGDTITVEISAQDGRGVDELLEMVSLVAELEDYRADPDGQVRGVVIESFLDKRAGVLATVIVQEGTLNVTDYIVSGEAWARVRRITDHAGKQLDSAGPSVPVQVLGFSQQPVAGDTVMSASDEQTAKSITAEKRSVREERERELIGKKNLTLADLFQKSSVKTINLILRADTQGSLEAIKGVLEREADSSDEVDLELMLADVGAPTESDLLLASTAEATILTFGVNAPGSVKKSAERQDVPLKSYRIIYNLIEDVQRMIRGQIEPEYEEQVLGHAEVRQVIRVPRSGNIAGSYITDGLVRRGAKARVIRAGREVYKGSIAQLRRFKDDVREVTSGFECGINLQNYDNIQEGDVIEIYEMVEIAV
jgi:translation initiation factor IF-2